MNNTIKTYNKTDSSESRNRFRKEGKHYRNGDEPYLRPIDRNDRARILYVAEALDRETRQKGEHGGLLKRTGLMVLKVLLCRFANLQTGRCDPSADAIAKASGVSRSVVFEVLKRLEAAGIIRRYQRLTTYRKAGIWHTEQTSNAYAFNFPHWLRPFEGDLAAPLFRPKKGGESGNQFGTSTSIISIEPLSPELSTALARLGAALGYKAA